MRSRANTLRQIGQNDHASYFGQVAVLFQFVAYGDDVHGSMLRDQRTHGFEYHPVLRIIEARWSEFLHGQIHAFGFEQHCAQDRLFYIYGLRRLVAKFLS